jgi:hypothetical protein
VLKLFLAEVGLSKYHEILVQNEVGFDMLLMFDEADFVVPWAPRSDPTPGLQFRASTRNHSYER